MIYPFYLCDPWLILFLNSKQRLAVFDRLAVLNIDLYDFARNLGLDLIHQIVALRQQQDHVLGIPGTGV